METKRAGLWGQLKEKAFGMYQWALESRVALFALVGIVSLTVLLPIAADALQFLGCD
ncbi:MAG: hypothetical protein ACK42L_00010 [Thermoanaerobaculum sp.]